jgi:predicted amidohydrolase
MKEVSMGRGAERVTIAGVQMDCRIGEKNANLAAMERFARQAAARGARLVVFPECALTGYCFEEAAEARRQAETVPGPATEALGRLCRELGIWITFGLIELAGERFFNALAFLGPEGLAGPSYRKIHLPFLGLDRFASPGDRPFTVHETPFARVGLNICYDGGFPESSRVMALLGADLIALPTNWPPGAEEFAEHGIPTRALENHVYYIAVNRVGEERGFRFIGRSRICDPLGRTLAVAGPAGEELLLAEIEPERAREKRIVRVPGKHIIDRIADRRPEFYGPISKPNERMGRRSS